MAAHGEVTPMPDVALFADTAWESKAVYAWLDWLEKQLPFPVERVKRDGPNLGELWLSVAKGLRDRSGAPLPGAYLSPYGMLPFHCSKEFKTRVVQRAIRRRLGLESGERGPKDQVVEQRLGISSEERERMKDSELRYVRNRWPLIEKNMRRSDCLRWMDCQGYPKPPRSACICCPFRDDEQWKDLRTYPDDWGAATEFDKEIRPGYPGLVGAAYLHRSLVPLDQVDFDAQQTLFDWAMRQECEGVCGT
jgi:hypothetical protein